MGEVAACSLQQAVGASAADPELLELHFIGRTDEFKQRVRSRCTGHIHESINLSHDQTDRQLYIEKTLDSPQPQAPFF